MFTEENTARANRAYWSDIVGRWYFYDLSGGECHVLRHEGWVETGDKKKLINRISIKLKRPKNQTKKYFDNLKIKQESKMGIEEQLRNAKV